MQREVSKSNGVVVEDAHARAGGCGRGSACCGRGGTARYAVAVGRQYVKLKGVEVDELCGSEREAEGALCRGELAETRKHLLQLAYKA